MARQRYNGTQGSLRAQCQKPALYALEALYLAFLRI